MPIRRKPRCWSSQYVFFDVVLLNKYDKVIGRKAMFICKSCRHLCEWDDESSLYRCVCCGKKLTMSGADEILTRYQTQLEDLIKESRRRKWVR